ncbi:hypothetical protein ACJMK2_031992 [Sinanodonta woodiana]|uniref:Uncharacterized protein n=1 Tax=Sinanodonta woodiana TaxID=1069815 RepID=A0ABD3X1V2_SINWO
METNLNTNLVYSLLNTLSSTFSASLSDFSMCDIAEVRTHITNPIQEYLVQNDMELFNMADVYPEFLRVNHNKYSITVHIDSHKFHAFEVFRMVQETREKHYDSYVV